MEIHIMKSALINSAYTCWYACEVNEQTAVYNRQTRQTLSPIKSADVHT